MQAAQLKQQGGCFKRSNTQVQQVRLYDLLSLGPKKGTMYYVTRARFRGYVFEKFFKNRV